MQSFSNRHNGFHVDENVVVREPVRWSDLSTPELAGNPTDGGYIELLEGGREIVLALLDHRLRDARAGRKQQHDQYDYES